MPLITREEKGSQLTIQEMDGNLTYLLQNQEFSLEGVDMSIKLNSSGIELVVDAGGGEVSFVNFKTPSWETSPEPGTYTGVEASTDGEGTGLTLTITVDDSKSRNIVRTQVENPGKGYMEGDNIVVSTRQLGYSGKGASFAESFAEYTLSSEAVSKLLKQNIILSYSSKSGVNIIIPNLPTIDPEANGVLWNNGGSLSISRGSKDEATLFPAEN